MFKKNKFKIMIKLFKDINIKKASQNNKLFVSNQSIN